ncbi:hypothetical protein I4U23_017279 [Adineta vaga]|nr:hypothetical protein I4U23_017279 [Adineta vaga]
MECTKLIIDVPDDYEPIKHSRATHTRKQESATTDISLPEAKKKKVKGIKCANRCGKYIIDDPEEIHAIQCFHQQEYYDWIEVNCSRWLRNVCRVKLRISIDTLSWFCEDCIDMHANE